MEKQRLAASVLNAKDEDVYNCLSDNEVFADLFNGAVFQGEQVIKPEYLEEMNEKKQMKVPGKDGQPAVIKSCAMYKKEADWKRAFSVLSLLLKGSERSIMECRSDICSMMRLITRNKYKTWRKSTEAAGICHPARNFCQD